MQQPAFRFSVRSMMLAVGGVALMLGFLASIHTKNGCGQTNALLTFQVVDDRDGRSIPGAKIELFNDYSAPAEASAITRSDGLAETSCRVGSTTYTGPFLRSYRSLSCSYGVRIEADGYQPVDDYFHRGWKHMGLNMPVAPPVLIRLKRSPEALK